MNSTGAVSGTLILPILFNKGLLICADQSSGILDKGVHTSLVSTNQQKLFPLSKKCIMALCGSVIIFDTGNPAVIYFNAAEIVQQLFPKRKLATQDPFWDDLKAGLKGKFSEYLKTIKPANWIEESEDEDKGLFTIIFFYINENNFLQIAQVTFYYRKTSSPQYDVEINQRWFKGKYLTFGYDQVAYGLLDHQNQKYDALRNEAVIKPFVSNTSPAKISLNDALAFATRVMEASSIDEETKDYVTSTFNYLPLEGSAQFLPLPSDPYRKKTKHKATKKRRK